MKRRFGVSVALSLTMIVGGTPLARAAITTPYAQAGEQTLAQGVRHEWGTVGVGKDDLRQNINLIEFDPRNPATQIRLSQAGGVATSRKLVTDQAHDFVDPERRVVATVNGSTFFYIPEKINAVAASAQGLNVSDGRLINAGAPVSGAQILAFGVDDAGNALIGNPQLEMQLTMPDSSVVDLTRINEKRLETDVVLLTSDFDTHTWTTDLGDEYVVEGFDLPLSTTGTYTGSVVAVHQGQGDSAISPGQAVISVADGAAEAFGSLAVGDEVLLSISVDEPWQDMTNSVGGREMLVVDGASVFTAPGNRFARTAVGITADGDLILVTGDSGYTVGGGLSRPEMAQLMISLGAVDAVNLDGGNSTQMAVREPGADSLHMVTAVLSPPEDLRPVSNALQIVSPISSAPDLSAPVVDQPTIALSPVAKVAKSHAALNAGWSASDESAIDSVEVQARVGDGSWQSLATPSMAASTVGLQVPFGRSVRVRVRATDSWGNTSAWAVSEGVKATLVDDSDARIVRSGGWVQRSDSRSFGGAYRRSNTTSARATLQLTGYQVGMIGRVGPRGGPVQIEIDNSAAGVVQTYAATADHRRLLFLGPSSGSAGAHEIEVRNAGTAARPLLEIDAFIVLEAAP